MDRTTEVPRDSHVVIFFDRPIVPLVAPGSTTPPPATITPATAGAGRWINTSTWSWSPTTHLNGATRYTITVPSGLKAVDGTVLAQTARVQFETVRPAILSTVPANGDTQTDYRAPLTIHFNQSVTHASTAAAFSLHDAGGKRLSGTLSWPHTDTVVFHPAHSLALARPYRATMGGALRATEGSLAPTAAFTWRFTTAGRPAVTSANPPDGTIDVAVDGNTSDSLNSTGIQIAFSAPVDPDLVRAHVRIVPAPPGLSVTSDDSESANMGIVIGGKYAPHTHYRVTLSGQIGLYGQSMAAPFHLDFTTASLTPSVTLENSDSVVSYDAYRPVEIAFHATNAPAPTLNLYRLPEGEFRHLLSSDITLFKPSGTPFVTFHHTIHSRPNQSATLVQDLGDARGRPLQPGYYYLSAVVKGTQDDQMAFMLTRTSLTLKSSSSQTLLWATDLRSGHPVAHVPMRVLDRSSGAILVAGVAGPDGVLNTSNTQVSSNPGVIAVAYRPGDVALCSDQWGQGVYPADYGVPTIGIPAAHAIDMHTDRPIYRPGQVIRFHGIVRNDNDGAYSIPSRAGVEVTLAPPATETNTSSLFDSSVPLDSFGEFNGRIRLPSDARLGQDSLTATIGSDTFSLPVQVAAYRKPDFEVQTSPVQSDGNYTDGGKVQVKVAARYLFGVPLDRARIHWSVLSSDLFFSAPAYPDYTFQDVPHPPFEPYASGPVRARPAGAPTSSSAAGSALAQTQGSEQGPLLQGTARTDSQGGLTLSIPADLRYTALSQQWSVEATVSDLSNTSISHSSTVLVHKGLFYVGLRAPATLNVAGKPLTIDLLTIGQDATTLRPNVPVALTLYRRTYRNTNGSPGAPGWVPVDTYLKGYGASTGADGHGRLRLTLPRAGEYRLVATAHDDQHHRLRSALSLYAVDSGDASSPWENMPTDQIRLVPDRQFYRIGDVAHVLIGAPRRGMTALVTIERGSIYSHQVLHLSADPVLRIPITARYLPNVFVSVVLVSGTGPHEDKPIWKMGVAELPVDVRARQLHVTLTAQTRTHPGETVAVHLHAAAPDGRPAIGRFALSVVDKGVLTLADEASPRLLDTFYAERGLGVSTAYSQNIAAFQLSASAARLKPTIRHQVFAKAALPNAYLGSAGGAGAAGRTASAPRPRTDFPDTAYWNPAVTTDASGNAMILVRFPDTLTTWRIGVRGATKSTLVGETQRDIVSTKDVLLQPAVPRFLTIGDSARIGAVVNNTTGRSLLVTVGLHASGSPITSTRRSNPQTIAVGAKSDGLVTWPIQAAGLGTLGVLLTATATGTAGDSVAITLPVRENSTPEVVATAGEILASQSELVRTPANAQPGEGGLTLGLQPSLAAGLRAGADLLQRTPYDSTSDLAARILGITSLTRLPASSTGLSSAERATYLYRAADAIAQLLKSQRSDGGWGWWSDDPQDSPDITAFCFDALTTARAAGYTVPASSLSAARSSLIGDEQTTTTPTTRAVPTPDLDAYIGFLLTESGGGHGVSALYNERAMLSLQGHAYLLRALYKENGGHLDARGRTVLSELEAGARQDATGAHWDATGNDAVFGDPVATTAAVLAGLVESDPTNPLIAPTTRWLMSMRQGLGWGGGDNDAFVLQALSDELRASGDLEGTYGYTATLGGRPFASGDVSPNTLTRTRVYTSTIGDGLAPGSDVMVGITRTATTGRLYYTLRLASYLPVEKVPALSQGATISREYLYNGRSVSAAPVGATVHVRLRISAPQDLSYVSIEDPLPAGAEGVDPTLLTTTQLAQAGYTVPKGTDDLTWYIDHAELRDDQAALFADYLPAGTYRYEYTIHLTTRGTFHALPAHINETYAPDVSGRSAGGYFTVQ